MKTAVIVLALIALASAAPKATKLSYRNLYKQPIKTITNPSPRIIGGREATPHSIPWQAFLEVYSSSEGWYCGGSLISANYVVTAGHCGDGARQAYVTLGAHNINQNEDTQVEIESSDIKVHERYDGDEIINDIAVIGLPQAVSLNNAINTVDLPSANDGDFAGETATASGWGLTDGHGNSISDTLNEVDLKVISNRDCEEIFGSLESSILCTSGDQNTGTCSGDSGGPLAIGNTLIGITSFGVQYCPGGYPSAFTRVTSFVSWLQSNTDV
ncbi:hypothetical protein Zmor_025796 [Zophobas morio]|uniref:Peptidase S1 domain-containing protein n=1 Tax=Zophobas morio TaxID=2755281 RepID=A0AA38M4Y1_9CUCU|nr:hypothetical protein Zmor_025796 [Zophobas morio]